MKFRYLIFLIILLGPGSVQAAPAEFVHCFNFGCKSTSEIDFNVEQWGAISSIFTLPALSAWLEKQQIRRAIALMESFSGELTGTYQDRGGNYSGEDLPYQQDCIDESTNTYQYLRALQKRDLLQWHQVAEKQRRIVWLATHWTAVIRENETHQLYAVDSWYRDNGELPYIQKIEDWRHKAAFSDSFNP